MLAAAAAGRAQEVKTIPSTLTRATVYTRGAELTHTATATLPRGASELTIEGLPAIINPSGVKIAATGGVVVTAYEWTREQQRPDSPQVKKMRDSLVAYEVTLGKLNSDIGINSAATGLLQKGVDKNVAGSDKGLGIDEFARMMEYHKSKSEALYAEKTALTEKKDRLVGNLNLLAERLKEAERQANSTPCCLKLSLSSPLAQSCKFTLSYLVLQASWTLRYDIVVADVGAPVGITMKAAVEQRTGMDWDKVQLTLATAMPVTHQASVPAPWFLGRTVNVSHDGDVVIDSRAVDHEEIAYQRDAENTKFYVRGTGSPQSNQNTQPLVFIDGRESNQAELAQIAPESIKSFETLKADQATARYGSRGANGVILITLKRMSDYVNVSDDTVWANYEIDLPASIPSGKTRNIDLKSMQAAAEYKYYCAPKLDHQVYLLAEIRDWEKLGLMRGQANITFNGTRVGETRIDPSSSGEKLSLTLGADSRIAVKREKLKDYSSTKTFGSEVTQVFTYQITLKNNRNQPATVIVKDQYPISTNKAIEVVLSAKDTTPWKENDAEKGIVTWEEELAPGEAKTLRISYSVKYPKGMELNL